MGPEDSQILFEHAHNDYLEMLLEGGVVGLIFSVFGSAFVFHRGYRAAVALEGRPSGELALGGLFAFTTLVIHSFGDFGLHIPAITLLAAVLAAQLCALGDDGAVSLNRTNQEPGRRKAASEFRLRLGGLAPLLVSGLCVAIGLTLILGAWQAQQVERLENTAIGLGQKVRGAFLEEQIDCLQKVASLVPFDATRQAALGRARARLFEREVSQLQRGQMDFLLAAAVPAARAEWPATLTWYIQTIAIRDQSRREQARLVQKLLLPALRNYVCAETPVRS